MGVIDNPRVGCAARGREEGRETASPPPARPRLSPRGWGGWAQRLHSETERSGRASAGGPPEKRRPRHRKPKPYRAVAAHRAAPGPQGMLT